MHTLQGSFISEFMQWMIIYYGEQIMKYYETILAIATMKQYETIQK